MSSSGSVSRWIDAVKRGDAEGIEAIWDRYFPELVCLAERRLRGTPRTAEDEQDVAARALESFFRAAENGRFPDLADREGLWRLISTIAQRRAIDVIRRQQRNPLGLEVDLTRGRDRSVSPLQHAPDPDPTPMLATMLEENLRRRLEALGDRELVEIALLKMDGYSNAEIAERLSCALRTIERRLELIRKKWQRELT